MDLAWALSSCCSTLTVLPRVTWCSSFHPKRWYETKLSGPGRSLYVFLTIAWSQSMTVSGRKKWSALPYVVGGAPQSRKLELILRTVRKSESPQGQGCREPCLEDVLSRPDFFLASWCRSF